MQYSPKLKAAMELIKDILKAHDIGGIVILHTPGYCEYLVNIQPSYSCVSLAGANVCIRAKLADFNDDKEVLGLSIANTCNMLGMLSMNTSILAKGLDNVKLFMDDLLGDEHEPGGETSHTQQNS